MGGSINTKCIWDIVQRRNYNYIANSHEDIIKAMTFKESEPKGFHRFLDKFKILDEIEWDEELIDISVKSICDDLELENIDYCWLDFSINKYMHLKWHKSEAIKHIHSCFEDHRPGKVGLILSLKYESLQESQRQYAKLIDDHAIADILLGIDLVGDEEYFDADFYAPILKDWRNAGKIVRAHVGESQSHINIEKSIIDMGVTNIAHGIKCIGHDYILDISRDNNITYDVAISSNYYTGVWHDMEYHPVIYMIENGINVTIGSDDPVQCSTTLNKEYQLFKQIADGNIDVAMAEESLRKTAYNNTKNHVRTFGQV